MALSKKRPAYHLNHMYFTLQSAPARTLAFAFLKERHVSLTAPTFMDSSRDTLKQTFNQI
ncbi:hypothetical protein [Bacillus atrophaeus]|uniref:hypothetical protein n=1 Tax=Bacillus atrophaeus TaxID=1452 RepID=UPI0036F1A178